MMNLKAESARPLCSIFSPKIAALSHKKNVNIEKLFAIITS
jgi:hypothetical protein